MGVDVPDLDDRSYEDLLEDARKQISVVDEDWTDHNAHDPGITILELLAWLSESYRYQLDQVEDRHRRKYAQLLGVSPRPPQPATGDVRVAPDASVAGETVPANTRLVADDGSTERRFETTRDVVLSGASVAKVVADTPDGRGNLTPAADADGTYFQAFGDTAVAGSTLYLGFDTDPFASPNAPLELHVDYHDTNLPPTASHGAEPVDFEPTVDLSWEYCTDYRAWELTSTWESFDVLADTTDSLYGTGRVVLAHPGRDRWQGVAGRDTRVLDQDGGYAWIRVQLESPGYEIPPQVKRVRTNVLPVAHRVTVDGERLTRADGSDETSARPHQCFEFDHAPVLDADVDVGDDTWTHTADVDPYGRADRTPRRGPVEFTTRNDFDASGPDDHHYVIEYTEGAIRFGDNIRGAVPDADEPVEATSYTYGGGPDGNVPADSEWWFEPPPATGPDVDWAAPTVVRNATVSPLGPAAGGRAAEDVDDALERLRRDLDRPYRAVTASDCEYVALNTPGLRFGRARAVVTDGDDVGDCVDHDEVRVVLVPFSPSAIDRPTPSEGFLEAVDCHLESHRLLTDRVTATAPTYVDIGVTVKVELEPGYVADRRIDAITDALDEFLSPLRGFDGDGWPFGRSVYYSELYERVGDVDGVDCVTDVDVAATGEGTVVDDAVDIPDTALAAPADHTVLVERAGRDCGEVR